MSAPVAPAALAAAFVGVDGWVFDLDNTLYPAKTDLFAQINARIRAYVARVTGAGPAEAAVLQKDYYRRYGTTFAGLMAEHGIDALDYLADVHDIDHSVVAPDPALAAALDRLPGAKYVLTNGSADHAERTMARLGIAGRFADVFDIVAADLVPKPAPAAYDAFFRRTGVDPARAAMFEDLSRNLAVPRRRGMRTVLIVPGPDDDGHGEAAAAGAAGRDENEADFVADDLAGFLAAVADAIGT